jgi:hypothetical protein
VMALSHYYRITNASRSFMEIIEDKPVSSLNLSHDRQHAIALLKIAA